MSNSISTVGSVLKSIVSGKSVQTLERPSQGNEFGILRVSSVTWGNFKPTENKAMPEGYNPGECPRAMNGDILISRANTRELVGAPVMVHGDYPNLLLSDKLLKLIPDESKVFPNYLVRALRFPQANQHFQKCAGGSSGSMTNITQEDIRSAPIPLPSITEQRRIAAILDQADALRAKRREALAQLDSLTQSIFIEMFGDPIQNPRGWKVLPLEQCSERIQIGPFGAQLHEEDYIEGGIPLLNPIHLRDGSITPDLTLTIARSKYEELSNYYLMRGDLIMGRRGEMGRCAVITEKEHGWLCGTGSLFVRPDKSQIDPVYLKLVISSPSMRRFLENVAQGVTMANLNKGIVGALPITLPPVELQLAFLNQLNTAEQLRSLSRQSLSQLDTLFSSLQHRAFLGEL